MTINGIKKRNCGRIDQVMIKDNVNNINHKIFLSEDHVLYKIKKTKTTDKVNSCSDIATNCGNIKLGTIIKKREEAIAIVLLPILDINR